MVKVNIGDLGKKEEQIENCSRYKEFGIILKDTKLTKEELNKMIHTKKAELKGLISTEGALIIVGKELGVSIPLTKGDQMMEDLKVEELEIEEIQIDDIQVDEVKVAKVPTIPSKREVKIEQKKRSSNLTNIFVFVGPKGSGKTKSASDFIKLLKPNKRMAYFDSEFKADKIIDNWHKGKPVDILNFTIVDPVTYKTKKTETLEEFEKEFQAKWIPKLKSGLYQYLVIDKGNVFWKMGEEYYYRITPNPPPAQFAWGKIYAIVLEKIFDALVNCCRINGIDLILCFNIKRAYKNDKQVGYKADVDSNEELLGFADYYLWLEMDYERFILKHPLKPFWRIVDEDLNVTDYLFNREFILETGELTIGNKTYKREFKRYVDFLEDTMLSTNKLQKRKQLIEEVDLGED